MKTTIKITQEDVDRLRGIKEEIKSLIEEAKDIIRKGPPITWARAKSYCYSHIVTSLDGENEFVGNSTFSLQDIIEELENCLNGEDEDEDDIAEN